MSEDGLTELNNDELPRFIRFDPQNGKFTILTTEDGEEGKYSFRVSSQIDNYAQTELSTTFNVIVYPNLHIVYEPKPVWQPLWEPQRILFGDSLTYKADILVIPNNYTYSLRVHEDRIEDFGWFNKTTMTLEIDGSKVTDFYVGTHIVTFVAEFVRDASDANLDDKYDPEVIQLRSVLTIEIYKNPPPKPPKPEPEPVDPKKYPEFDKDDIRDNLIPEKDGPGKANKPTPRLVSLSSTGQLRIGWDSEMVPPVEPKKLPEKKIAIKNDTYFNEDEIRERLTYEEIWVIDDDNSTSANQTKLRLLSDNATTIDVTGNATEPAKERHVFYYAIIDALEIRIVA